ncbi:MAG: trypsin-like serine protease [Bdellovibrio sp.]|nr:trypsin-like serine protease [Bdellovibrio sp.]
MSAVSHVGIVGGGEVYEDGSDLVTSTVALVAIAEDGSLQSFCTGILVSKDLVVTAGHCLQVFDGGGHVQVAFGRVLPLDSSDSRLRSIDRYYTYEMTQPRVGDSNAVAVENDIAVLKLSSEAPYWARPAAILANASAVQAGDHVILAGFGQTSETSKTSRALHATELQIKSLSEKALVFDQSVGTGACYGDSGGPVYIRTSQRLIAVAATRGIGNGGHRDCRHEAIYTLLPSYQDFIKQIAALIGGEQPEFINL